MMFQMYNFLNYPLKTKITLFDALIAAINFGTLIDHMEDRDSNLRPPW